MRIRLSLFVFVALLCTASSAHALKQPLGPEFSISNPSTASAGAVSVGADSDTGRYIVVWGGGDGKLRGRLIGHDGTPLTDEIVIAEESGAPVVAYNAALHEYLVVWAGYAAVRAQRVSASGTKIGGVITAWSYGGHAPSVACSSQSGACLVVAAGFGISARLIGSDGVPAGPEMMLAAGDGQITRVLQTTAVAYAPEADRYLVAWHTLTWNVGEVVMGRLLDSAGSPMGEFAFVIAGGHRPALAYNPVDQEFGAIFGRRASGADPASVAGARAGQTVAVGRAQGYVTGTSLAFDLRERSYLAAWTDEGTGGGSFLNEYLVPIAPADFARGSVVTYNRAADEYLLVRPSCDQPGGLKAVCGRRVGNPPAAADRTGPRLRLTVRRLQRIVRQRGLVLRARCDEACTVRASARIALPGASRSVALRRVTKSLTANVRVRLKLKTSRRALRKLRRALRTRHRLGARLTVTAADSPGNRTIAKRKLRARR